MKCNICQLDKPETEFYQRKAERQGEYLSTCKTCRSQRKQTQKWADVEKSRKNMNKLIRIHRRKNIEKYREREKTYRQDDKYIKMNNAGSVVKRALKRGKIHKPKLCEFCFQPKKLGGHHEDYSKPLDVKWLCASCHNDWHRWKTIFNVGTFEPINKQIKYPEKYELFEDDRNVDMSLGEAKMGMNKLIDEMKRLNGDGGV